LTAVTRVPLDSYEARRIALLKPSALGDIVHCLPLLAAIRERFPGAYLAWVVNRGYAPLLEGHPDLDAIIPFDRGAMRRGLSAGLRQIGAFLTRLRAERFDLVLDLQGLFRSGFMCWATRAPRVVGLADAREGARLVYTDVVAVPDPENIHAVDRYGLVAKALGCQTPTRFHLPIAGHARETAARLLSGQARPWLVVAVGSRWLTKRWPPRHFAELANRAMNITGGTAIFVGGPEDGQLARETFVHVAGPCLDLTGKTSLPELVAVLERADTVIANDTGPLHLAVALRRPVVAPYTCTRVRLTGPYGAYHQAVESRVWCAGSCVKECSRMECMAELTPDRLWPVLERNLEKWQSSSRSA
jgi:lipopolysaccharide heptosyltransferase I